MSEKKEEKNMNQNMEETEKMAAEETAEVSEEANEVSEEEFNSFKKKRLCFQLLMVLSFVWLIGMGFVVMIKDSVLLGVIVGVVFVGALVGSVIFGFSSYAVFCPHCHKLLGLEIRHCANCGNELR